jgi:hypothetical protein
VKDSEYGGADTADTNGIQPPPNGVIDPHSELRLLYATDPADETSVPHISMKKAAT